MKGGKREKAGRKAIHIDIVELEKLSSLQCTDPELAAILQVSVRTIERRKKQPAFADVIERGRPRCGRLEYRAREPGTCRSVRRTLICPTSKRNIIGRL